jgi:BirA family biotin operon repressor/biotin-[acetyl-CoA-carboxylase] ligase
MTLLKLGNPFNAPVFHEETTDSTMNISRQLALNGEPHGAVIACDYQEAGRGRAAGRLWQMESKINLPFSLLLRYKSIEEIPSAITLRTGLAVSAAIEEFEPALTGKVKVKWPNDIIIGAKKAAGILTEADGGNVHIGIGINFAQKIFPEHLTKKATSVALAAGREYSQHLRFILLEKILEKLYGELETEKGKDWKDRLEKRTFKINENVVFIEGAAGSGKEINGRLCGISENGELLIIPNGETEPKAFITGELLY